jgi:hypothetical protein
MSHANNMSNQISSKSDSNLNPLSIQYILNSLLTAPKQSMCKEACWAQSASTSELHKKYGSGKIPTRFKFADPFYRKGSKVYMKCMAPHGPMAVMNETISRKCTTEANKVCTQSCLSAFKK